MRTEIILAIVLVGCVLSHLSSGQQTCTSGAECSTSDPATELQVSLLQKSVEIQKIVQADEHAANSASRSSLANQVRAINQRFQTGKPSNELNEAGVFVHGVDLHTEADCFFCPPRHGLGRLSGSLINARAPYVFLGLQGSFHPPKPITSNWTLGAAGVIYTPQAVAASMRCTFPTDAATDLLSTSKSSQDFFSLRKQGKGEQSELPSSEGGCVGYYAGRLNPYWDGEMNQPDTKAAWCSDETESAFHPRNADMKYCARRPQNLAAMLLDQERQNEEILKDDPEGQCRQTCCLLGQRKGPSMTHCRLYNEVVLDHRLLKQQPNAVEGIYYVTDSAARNKEQAAVGEKLARSFVKQWHKTYGIQVPLMKVRDFNLPQPFEFVEDRTSEMDDHPADFVPAR